MRKNWNINSREKKLEVTLLKLCSLVMRIKRQADREGVWLMGGINDDKELTTEAQQGPLITELFGMVDSARKIARQK